MARIIATIAMLIAAAPVEARTDCEAMRGTEYRPLVAQEEREYFLANCIIPEPLPAPTPAPAATPTAPVYVQPANTRRADPAVPAPPPPVPAGAGVEQWRGLVTSVFPSWAVDTVLRIMDCESEGDPYATGLAGERGLMQIHPVHHDSTYDPLGNILAAYRISSGGTDFSAWSCK